MGADCRFKTDEQGYPHGLETSILWTREGVRRKVVVSDVITLIVVVMWLQLGWFMNRGRAWNWTFIAERRYLDPKRGHPTIAMVDHHLVNLKSHLEVYCLTHASCGGKKTRSVLAQTPMSLFAVPMDARTCHFHCTVGYLENGCRKIRMSSRMMMVMRRMMMMLMMMMVMMTRHCEGAAAWRDSPGICREFPLRGGGGSDCRCDVTPAWVVHEPWTGMKLDIHSWTLISGSEKRAPHDCHGWSSLSLFKEPFGGILSDTRIVRGKKKRSVLAQTPKSLLRYLWMLEPVTFIAPLGTWKMDVEKSECQVEWWLWWGGWWWWRWWRWWWWWWWWWWGWWRWCWWWDTAKGLLREETHKACDESSFGGGMELDIQSRAEISGSEKRAPHDVHGCSSLRPFK